MICPSAPHTHPAEMLFTEQPLVVGTSRTLQDGIPRIGMSPPGVMRVYGTWTGRLIMNGRHARDLTSPVGHMAAVRVYRAEIYEVDGPDGSTVCLAMTQGDEPASRRFTPFLSVSAAQAHIVRWSARRFRFDCSLGRGR